MRKPSILAIVALFCLAMLPVAPVRADSYADELAAAGFPASYHEPLIRLHEAHPSWVFTPYVPDVSWSEALAAESRVGVNLVASTAAGSWKSMEAGAYDWNAGKWIGKDGDKWVAASRQIVAYALDTRNYLTETHVFAFLKQSDGGTQTVDGVQAILAGTWLAGSFSVGGKACTYAEAVFDAAKAAGMSAYMLAARLRQEQGASGNTLGHGTVPGYSGYYNLFNIKAYATASADTYTNGAIYAKAQGWDSPYKAIVGGAAYIADGYIAVGQDTLYLQKFDLVAAGGLFNHQYMANTTAIFNEAAGLRKAFPAQALDAPLEFVIPVLAYMPEAPVMQPVSAGNNNCYLSALSVNGTAVSGFDRYTYAYSLTTDKASLSVEAVCGSGATVRGSGTHALVQGDNRLDVTVTAPSGVTRVYTLTVRCTAAAGTSPPTTAKPPVATIRGDADGDGRVSVLDVLVVRRHLLGLETAGSGGDFDGDGRLTEADIAAGIAYIVGKS